MRKRIIWNVVRLYRPIFLIFENNFLVSKVESLLRASNFPKYVFMTKVNWWRIFNFRWHHQNLVSVLWIITHQSRDPVNDVTNRYHFTRGIPGANFKFIPYLRIWDTRGLGIHSLPWTPTIVETRCTFEGLSSITTIKTPTKYKHLSQQHIQSILFTFKGASKSCIGS